MHLPANLKLHEAAFRFLWDRLILARTKSSTERFFFLTNQRISNSSGRWSFACMCQKRCVVSTQIISHCTGRQGHRCHHCKWSNIRVCSHMTLHYPSRLVTIPQGSKVQLQDQTLCPLKLGKPVSIMIPWWLFHQLSRSSLHFSGPVWTLMTSLVKWREGRPTAEEHFNDSWEHACGALNIWIWLINGSFHD